MKDIKILKENSVYRVTDLILCKGIRWEKDRKTILNDPKYKNTILYEYLTCKRYERDFYTLKKIVNQHKVKYKIPDQDSLVIHLRLGDVMDDYEDQKFRNYVKYKNIYGNLDLEFLPLVNKATIVTALHFGANKLNNKYFYSDTAKERSYEILDLLTTRLNSKGINVTYKSSSNIDDDICYMAGSKHFMKSLSGLSEMVGQCMDYNSYIYSPENNKFTYKSRYSTIKQTSKEQIKQLLNRFKNRSF